jgi:energy-coupling factor transporter ATP-binding protein EcfA2
MKITLPAEIYGTDKFVTLNMEKKIHTFIGSNGSGKTLLVKNIKGAIGRDKVKVIAENITEISVINSIDPDHVKSDSLKNNRADDIVSLLNADGVIRTLIFYWFEVLFDKKIYKDGRTYYIKENTNSYPLENDGDGFKVFFNLIYYIVDPKFKNIVFEEPERYLHPNLQICLYNMMKKMSKDYKKRIFIITHNNNFIDLLSDEVEVFLLKKSRQEIYNVTSIINGITDKMGFKLWIHYNKQILFSKAIVLLEGFTDQILLNHLISKLNHSAFGRNISFISVAVEKENGGKCRIPEFQKNISLFFNCWALYDLDLLLNTGKELSKYISNTMLSNFKDKLDINNITDKESLISFYEAAIDTDFIDTLLDDLRQNHNVLVLQKGEIENYCISFSEGKLAKYLSDEIEHLNSNQIDIIKRDYNDLIKILDNVDNICNQSTSDLGKILYESINKFYTQYYNHTPYDWENISDELKNHLVKDPDHMADDKFRFSFRFLSEKEFILPKEVFDKEKILEIDRILSI